MTPLRMVLVLLLQASFQALAVVPGLPPFPRATILALRQIKVEGERIQVLPTQGRALLKAFKNEVQAWAIGQLAAPAESASSDQERAEHLKRAWDLEAAGLGDPPEATPDDDLQQDRFSGEVTAQVSAPKGHQGLLLLEATAGYHCGDDALVLLLCQGQDRTWNVWSAFPEAPAEVTDGFWGLQTTETAVPGASRGGGWSTSRDGVPLGRVLPCPF